MHKSSGGTHKPQRRGVTAIPWTCHVCVGGPATLNHQPLPQITQALVQPLSCRYGDDGWNSRGLTGGNRLIEDRRIVWRRAADLL